MRRRPASPAVFDLDDVACPRCGGHLRVIGCPVNVGCPVMSPTSFTGFLGSISDKYTGTGCDVRAPLHRARPTGSPLW
jgi:hypothetical protein